MPDHVIVNMDDHSDTRSHNETVLQSLQPGDLVMFLRQMIIHWAVYIGNGEVVHATGDAGTMIGSSGALTEKGEIRKDDFWKVAKDSRTEKGNHMDNIYQPYPPEQVTKNALNQLGKLNYNLFQQNCEHFAHSCRYGLAASFQADLLKAVCSRLSINFSISTMKFAFLVYFGIAGLQVVLKFIAYLKNVSAYLEPFLFCLYVWAIRKLFNIIILRSEEEKKILGRSALLAVILVIIFSDGIVTTFATLSLAAIPFIHAVVSTEIIVRNLLKLKVLYCPGVGHYLVALTAVVKNIGSFIVSCKALIGFILCYFLYYVFVLPVAMYVSSTKSAVYTRHDSKRFAYVLEIQMIIGILLFLFYVLCKVIDSWQLGMSKVIVGIFKELRTGEIASYSSIRVIQFAMSIFVSGFLFVVVEFIMISYTIFD